MQFQPKLTCVSIFKVFLVSKLLIVENVSLYKSKWTLFLSTSRCYFCQSQVEEERFKRKSFFFRICFFNFSVCFNECLVWNAMISQSEKYSSLRLYRHRILRHSVYIVEIAGNQNQIAIYVVNSLRLYRHNSQTPLISAFLPKWANFDQKRANLCQKLTRNLLKCWLQSSSNRNECFII